MVGKLVGVFGGVALMLRLDFAHLPAQASWGQMFGVALLCGIGFTMSLFVGLLAFAGNQALQNEIKVGIVAGSVTASPAGRRGAAQQPTGGNA